MSVALSHARDGASPRLAWALALLLVLAACSSSAASPSVGGGGTEQEVSLAGSAFSPDTITIAAGEGIVFNNDDTRNHRIVEGEDGVEIENPAFEAVSVTAGDVSGPITIDEPGTYILTCTIHPSMAMTVIVE